MFWDSITTNLLKIRDRLISTYVLCSRNLYEGNVLEITDRLTSTYVLCSGDVYGPSGHAGPRAMSGDSNSDFEYFEYFESYMRFEDTRDFKYFEYFEYFEFRFGIVTSMYMLGSRM